MSHKGLLERINNQKFAFYHHDKELLRVDFSKKNVYTADLSDLISFKLSTELLFSVLFCFLCRFAVVFYVYSSGGWFVGWFCSYKPSLNKG